MAQPQPTERLRFSTRSVIVAIGLLGATLAGLRLIAASTRVLGWLVAAVAIAAMLQPLVALLGRWIPRPLAGGGVVAVPPRGAPLAGCRRAPTRVPATPALP